MRTAVVLAILGSIVLIALPAVAQQPTSPTAAPRQTGSANPAAEPIKMRRYARAGRRHHRHVYRYRRENICSVINGWRAFNNRHDPKGYFYTGPVCCCG